VLSIIGLSLDVVGAVALAVGLFGRVVPSTWGGDVRSPEGVAHDTAFGLIGAPFLIAGFVVQSLYYFDIHWMAPVRERVYAAVITLAVATLAAYVSYGFLYRRWLASAQRFRARSLVENRWEPPPPRFRKLRWWL
jgi:hypothetical protein